MSVRRALWVVMVCLCCAGLQAQMFNEADAERDLRHQRTEWAMVGPHLPDLKTGAPADLVMAGDVLRARRMPEDAVDYYRAALLRGVDESQVLNRLGVTLLELREPLQARACFRRATLLKKKDAEGWNNLGASEYVMGNFTSAVYYYQRAVKLNKKMATFHSNLGTAYFDLKNYEDAQKQFETALKLDPSIFQKAGFGGVQAHVLSPNDRGRFCFEMARLAARQHQDAMVIEWLGKAIETGYDIKVEMRGDSSFEGYLHDARVEILIKNAKAMHGGQVAAVGPAPALPAE